MPILLRSYQRQNLLLEFAAFKHVAPLGVYAALTPGDPRRWTGVLFVRKGPYSPAILRFSITFPLTYPLAPPVIVFATDLFHPLLTPLTLSSYGPISSDANTVSANPNDLLPPGGFSLKHGFPHWFQPPAVTPDTSPDQKPPDIAVVEVLIYIRSAFESDAALDAVPLSAAANQGAWYAWQAHRGKNKPASPSVSTPQRHTPRKGSRDDTPTRSKGPSEWKWDGVWQERVRRALSSNSSEPALFGTQGLKEEDIHFLKLETAQVDELKADFAERFEV